MTMLCRCCDICVKRRARAARDAEFQKALPIGVDQAVLRSAVLIEVREQDEFEACHLPSAIHASHNMLGFKLGSSPALTDPVKAAVQTGALPHGESVCGLRLSAAEEPSDRSFNFEPHIEMRKIPSGGATFADQDAARSTIPRTLKIFLKKHDRSFYYAAFQISRTCLDVSSSQP